ncbi:MAG: hypothetical protein E7612_05325 [Ruminococcaceae bacterium]|nr:hypothetical protein [Oscillospiraceae bacterium]
MTTDRVISLNGAWDIEYISKNPYYETNEPVFTENKITAACAVPAYFEDLEDELRSSSFFEKIAVNPLFEHQAYPITAYAPDMALPNFVGAFAYTRRFSLDSISENAYLYFGGVQNRVSVWVNGAFVGEHDGYSSDFEFEIKNGILRKGENIITLAVSNNRLSGYMGRAVSGLTSRAANECTGGIYGDVEIRFCESGVRDVWILCSENLAKFTVNVIGNCNFDRYVSIFDGEKELTRVKIPSGESSITVSSLGFEPWSPSSPKLYEARISDNAGNIFTRKFGIRRLVSKGTKLHLNGKPYFFRGICEHCYHPITVHPTRDKNYYISVIKTIKNLGFNSIRFHTYVPPAEYMEAADEEGILIEVETPNNTSLDEWRDIVRMTRRYTSVIAYSSGNEMLIDEDYIEHLRAAAKLVHTESDSLFSPMSAMRGVEYFSYGDCRVDTPFPHNPKRLEALSEFCDIYNAYSLGLTSYTSAKGDRKTLDERNSIYKKPLLSHEICIHGTYCDLSLKSRYEGTRIGKTELFTSVERHLSDMGLIDRAELYYKNSVKWQKLLRKRCFELIRRCESFAGYDFLGDIDTHWHTFGYCVGMMNEFYELKEGENAENVRRYNSDTVLLCDLPKSVNFKSGEKINLPIFVSNYDEPIKNAVLTVALNSEGHVIFENEISLCNLNSGEITELYTIKTTLPTIERPLKITVSASLVYGGVTTENEWNIYQFPTPCKKRGAHSVTVSREMSRDELISRLEQGERILIYGAGPFDFEDASFQISLAGRTNGHLATVINKHPLTDKLSHNGFLDERFEEALNGSKAVILDSPELPFEPIIEIATSYKNAHREALLFEYKVGRGKLIVCSLNLSDEDPLALFLKAEIESYAESDEFEPKISLTKEELLRILNTEAKKSESNTNLAFNKNDITAN